MTPKSALARQPNLFSTTPNAPPGFAYVPGAFSEDEERELTAAFPDLPFKPFEFHGFLGKRRIVSYGWRYDFAGRALRQTDDLPDFLLPLRERAGKLAGLPAAAFQQAIVTEYATGAGIGWHRDKPMFEDVVAFSFLSTCVLRLRLKAKDHWKRSSFVVEPRAAYLLRGESRRLWEHSIPPVDALRYSVTFRNFAPR